MPRPTKARKIDEEQRERFLTYLHRIPPQDAMIMSAGAIAGSQGYTPMTMILKALKGGVGVGGMGNFQVNDILPLLTPGQAFNPAAYVGFGKILRDVIMPPSSGNASASSLGLSYDDLKMTAALASVGMIESYMITRPGAFGAVLNMVQSGVSGIAGLAKEGGGAAAGL
jgi:hypothetical protein